MRIRSDLMFAWLRRKKTWPRPLRYLATALGIVWALPLTLTCSILALPALIGHAQLRLVRRPTPAVLLISPLTDFLLEHHPFGPMSAMALGHIVIAQEERLSHRILTHELAHVRQAAQWGILFPFVYLAASIWAMLRGKDAYWHNAFEVAARKAEKHA